MFKIQRWFLWVEHQGEPQDVSLLTALSVMLSGKRAPFPPCDPHTVYPQLCWGFHSSHYKDASGYTENLIRWEQNSGFDISQVILNVCFFSGILFSKSTILFIHCIWVCAHMCKCICVSVHVCHDVHVEVRGQLAGASVFLSCYVLRIKLGLSGLAMGLYPWVILLALVSLQWTRSPWNPLWISKPLLLYQIRDCENPHSLICACRRYLPWDLELLTRHQFLTIMTLKDWVQILVHIYGKSH